MSIMQGELLEWDVNKSGEGEFSVRGAGSQVDRCRVTTETYLTRQSLRIAPGAVRPGDRLQVVADMRRGLSQCHAVTIYILPPDSTPRTYSRPTITLPPPPRGPMDSLWARGSITYTGIVLSVENDRLRLKTRRDGEKLFLLRPDTVYTTGGKVVERAGLALQTQVFVRAGRSLGGEVEAYQIIWGDILTPEKEQTIR